MCNLKRISCVHLVSSPKLSLAWWSCFAQHVENLGKIIQDQNNASQKETNNFEASHTRDNSVEPPTPSAIIEVQVPTFVAFIMRQESMMHQNLLQIFFRHWILISILKSKF